MSPTLIAGLVALVVFCGGGFYINVLRDEVRAEHTARVRAEEAGNLCSDNTRILAEAGDEALARAETERDVATAKAQAAGRRANAIINAPQSVPGDACASAAADINTWLQERRK